MTTVSRFYLASKLLCFSRFDEGEYIPLKLVSHETRRLFPQTIQCKLKIAHLSIYTVTVYVMCNKRID